MHGQLPPLPEGDVLVFAGDATSAGERSTYESFDEWLGRQPFKYRIAVPGNHDFQVNHSGPPWPVHFMNATTLIDSGVTIEGVRFYGSPWTPRFGFWAWMLERGSQELANKWAKIPGDVDVLITHGPPYGILDQAIPDHSEHIGDAALMREYDRIAPKFHIFGHIHGSRGVKEIGKTIFVNAAAVNEAYKLYPVQDPPMVYL